MDFENKLVLNTGIYTAKDISKILRISVSKVNRWIKSYWDDRFAKEFKKTYSWKVADTRAIETPKRRENDTKKLAMIS